MLVQGPRGVGQKGHAAVISCVPPPPVLMSLALSSASSMAYLEDLRLDWNFHIQGAEVMFKGICPFLCIGLAVLNSVK